MTRILTIILLALVLRRLDRACAMLADVLTMLGMIDRRFVPTPEQAELMRQVEELTQ